MSDVWKYEHECANSIALLRGDRKVAEIIANDDDLTHDHFEIAKFIVAACNKAETD